MTVNTTWTDPTGATLDLANGTVVTETNWDALVSNVNRLGGADGNTKTGPLQIGSTQTYSNANNTAGLTINQGGADDEILSLKSSDVAHGVTGVVEADTYAAFKKLSATDGGVQLQGVSEGTGGIALVGIHTTDNTTKSTAASAAIRIQGQLKSGTTTTALGGNANILTVEQATVGARFILDADGDSHQDVGSSWTNFHGHDDIALLNALSAHVSRKEDPLREQFAAWLEESREPLEKINLVTFNEDGHHFVNMSRLTMLHTGALIQVGDRITLLEERLAALLPSPRD